QMSLLVLGPPLDPRTPSLVKGERFDRPPSCCKLPSCSRPPGLLPTPARPHLKHLDHPVIFRLRGQQPKSRKSSLPTAASASPETSQGGPQKLVGTMFPCSCFIRFPLAPTPA